MILSRFSPLAHGLFLAVLVAMAAQFISQHYGAPLMLMAVLLGMPFQYLSQDARTAPGISFASGPILKVGVALLGLQVSFDMVQQIGLGAVLLVAMATLVTILFALGLGKILGKNTTFAFLTGGAVAICGASAALAINSILPKSERSEKALSFTVIAVTVLSTLAMILYPILARELGLSTHDVGVFLGATIHDVAQVVGAGFSVSDDVGELSTIIKLFRVTLLAPIVIVAALILSRSRAESKNGPTFIPLFVIVFIVLAGLNSFGWVPEVIIEPIGLVSRACLVVAVAAVGMKTSVAELNKFGASNLVMIVVPTLFLALFVLLGIFVLG